MFDVYQLEMEFVGRLMGSVPLKKELVRKWLEARAPAQPKPGPSLDEIENEVLDTIEDVEAMTEEEVSLGFQQVNDVLVVRAGTIKAHLKDCARQLYAAKLVSVKNFRSKVANYVNVVPYWIPILKDGVPVREHDGWHEQAVHVITPQGPRSALKRIQYVEGVSLVCRLYVLRNPEVGEEELRKVLVYGGVHGYGGERSLGEGRYVFSLERVGEADSVPVEELTGMFAPAEEAVTG